jgi:hypothetical protein
MKKFNRVLILILIISFGYNTINGQITSKGLESLSPQVKAAFQKKYASTSEENWTIVDNTIIISFKSGNDFYDAFFNEKGTWLRSELAILYTQLPKLVQDSLTSGEFSNWEKGSVYKVDLPGSDENYKIFVYSKDWNEMELNFNKSGKRIM